MSEPPRLLEQAGTKASTLELLRALDAPSAPPPTVRVALVNDLSGLVAGSGVKAAAVAVWLKASVVAALCIGAGGAWWWSRSASAPVATVTPVSVPRDSPPAVAPLTESSVALPVEPAPVAAPSALVPERAKTPASSAPRDSLAEEEALLEAARQAVSRSPAQALALLQKHRSQFPSGQLGAERMYLSVECLQRLGNHAAAQREAAALAKYYPNSAYARRAPLLLASPKR